MARECIRWLANATGGSRMQVAREFILKFYSGLANATGGSRGLFN